MERNIGSSTANRIIICIEIAALAAVIFAASLYAWKYFSIETFDASLQVAFAASIILLISVVANIVVNKRW